ncbi:MAG: VOC family protein [Myxococcota bacterium]
MRIEHVALWVNDLERSRAFYVRYFGAKAGEKYLNPNTGFASYFLSFESGARLELMQRTTAPEKKRAEADEPLGYAHLALGVGDAASVDALTQLLASASVPVLSGPRRTGDGYYESVVLDPEGNRIEIVADS